MLRAQRCLDFVRSRAPLVVHFKAEALLPLLAADSHYRNQFETNTSGGTLSAAMRCACCTPILHRPWELTAGGAPRSNGWEADMFASADLHSPAVDKVKYGALNITCDVRGVTSAHVYGDSYLLLKRGVRLRATFAYYDTGSVAVRKCLATCEHYAHVLNAYADAELKAALHVGAGLAPHGASGAAVLQYKEVQVHGPLELGRHVEAVVGALRSTAATGVVNMLVLTCVRCAAVNKRHRGDAAVLAAVEAFRKRHDTAVLWTDDLLDEGAASPAPRRGRR